MSFPRPLPLIALVITLALAAAPAHAEDVSVASKSAKPSKQPKSKATTRPYLSHDVSGFVFRADVPRDWKLTQAQSGSVSFVTPHKDKTAKHLRFHLRVYAPFGGPSGSGMPAKELREMLMGPSQPGGTKHVLKESLQTIGGVEFLRQDVTATKGTTTQDIYLMGIAGNDQAIYMEIRGRGRGTASMAIRESRPAIERMLASMRISATEKVTAKVKARMPQLFVPKAARISRRRDYHLDMTPSILVPAGWSAEEVVRQSAAGGNEKGSYAVRILPPANEDGSRRLAAVLVVLEGLQVGPLNPHHYLATLLPRVRAILPEAKLVSTSKVEIPGTRFLARSSTRYSTGTTSTHVRTFEHARAGGDKVVIKGWTAGGMTAASHVMVVAKGEVFDAFEAEVRELIDTYTVFLKSPSIR